MQSKSLQRCISMLLIIACISAFFPQLELNAEPHLTAEDAVQARIDYLLTMLKPGTYFSANGKACTHGSEGSCYYCNPKNVNPKNVSSKEKDEHPGICTLWSKLPSGAEWKKATGIGDCWTCMGFAHYVFWLLFGVSDLNKKETTWTITDTLDTAMIGDCIWTSDEKGKYDWDHVMIFAGWANDEHTLFYCYESNSFDTNIIRYKYVDEIKKKDARRKVNTGRWYRLVHANNYPGNPAFNMNDRTSLYTSASGASYFYVTAKTAYIKYDCYADYNNICTAGNGSCFPIIDKVKNKYGNIWYQIEYENGQYGWVYSDSGVETSAVTVSRVKETSNVAYIHTDPYSKASVVATPKMGDVLQSTGHVINTYGNRWECVLYKDSSGKYKIGYIWPPYIGYGDYPTLLSASAGIEDPVEQTDICTCTDAYAGKYKVTGSGGSLQIYSTHGTSGSGVSLLSDSSSGTGTIPEGTVVTITLASGYSGQGKSSGEWGHVNYNGVSGYVSMNCLSKYETASATTSCSCSTAYAGTYKVTGTDGSLAISSKHAASTSSGATQLGKIPEGTTITITKATGYNGYGKSSGNWGHVTYNGVSGYVAMNFLTKVETASTSPSTCSKCSTSYAGDYIVAGTDGSLAISSIHAPSTSAGAKQLGTIPEGTTIHITAATGYNGYKKSSGNWGHVTYNGVSGYCAMNYLQKVTEDTCSVAYAGWYKVTNTDGYLVISSKHAASTSSGASELGKIPQGAIVYISRAEGYNGAKHSSGLFGHVSYNGVEGYSSMNCLEKLASYKLTFNDNGGSGGPGSLLLWAGVSENNDLSGSIPVRPGFEFLGWYTASSGGEKVYDAAGKYVEASSYWSSGKFAGTSAMTLYAQWKYVDEKAPEISNIAVSNLSVTGFTVSCLVNDDVDVAQLVFEATANGIKKQLTPVLTDNVWSCDVNVSDHNDSVDCEYVVSITAVDSAGNRAQQSISQYIDTVVPVISDVVVSEVTNSGYKLSCVVADNDELLSVWLSTSVNGETVTVDSILAGGRYTFAVNISEFGSTNDSLLTSAVFAKDNCGNVSEYPVSVFVDSAAPWITGIGAIAQNSDGFTVCVEYGDNVGVESVGFTAYAADKGPSGAVACSNIMISGDSATAEVLIAEHDSYYGLYHVDVVLTDASGNTCSADMEFLLSDDGDGYIDTQPIASVISQDKLLVLYTASYIRDNGTRRGLYWPEASTMCGIYGGTMAIVDDNMSMSSAAALLAGYSSGAWVGLSRAENGAFVWNNGNSFSGSEPSGSRTAGNDYVMLRSDGKLYAVNSEVSELFVCQYDITSYGSSVLKVPSTVESIEAEAFTQTTARVVIIPDTCTEIGNRAFADCSELLLVSLPGSGIQIADDAFEGSYPKLVYR